MSPTGDPHSTLLFMPVVAMQMGRSSTVFVLHGLVPGTSRHKGVASSTGRSSCTWSCQANLPKTLKNTVSENNGKNNELDNCTVCTIMRKFLACLLWLSWLGKYVWGVLPCLGFSRSIGEFNRDGTLWPRLYTVTGRPPEGVNHLGSDPGTTTSTKDTASKKQRTA